jgi:long-chain acyl-CoA synthetase
MTLTEQAGSTTATTTITVTSRAREWALRAPNQVAMREKDFGVWREYTWAEVWEQIELAAHALLALGVQPGDRVSIHSEDRPEWIIVDLATVAVRGITVGLYPTNPTAEVEYVLTDSGSVIHVVEDQEQADKVFEIDRSTVSSVRTLIFLEPRGLVGATDDRLVFWENLLELGRSHRDENPGAVAARMAEARDDDVMTLVYTSGTTGPPKGAMLTNKNASFSIDVIVNCKDRVPGGPPNSKDQILTYLPLCHVAERIFSTWTFVSAGAVLNFAESIDVVNDNLREVQPTIFFAVRGSGRSSTRQALIKANDASWFKKRILKFGLRLGRRIGKAKVANGGDHTAASRLLYMIGWVLVFRAMRERLGLRRVRYAGSGAAPIAPEVLEFFIGSACPSTSCTG